MDEHEDLEHLLRRSLRPRQTPTGFAAKVMARLPGTAQAVSSQKRRTFFGMPALRWATAMVLLGVAGGSYWQRQEEERIAGERARAQLILALRMSATALNDVQHKVLRSTKGDSE
jgi:hypothetical protein